MGTIMALYEEREAQRGLLSCPGQGCEPCQPGNPVFPALLHWTLHHFDVLFPTCCVKTQDPNSLQGRITKTQQNQVLCHSVAHMLVLPRPITSAKETKPAADFSVICTDFCLLLFFFFFLPFRAASSGAAPLLCPNLNPCQHPSVQTTMNSP